MIDPAAFSASGHAAKLKMKRQRVLLGIGPNRVGSARQRARLAAAVRAEEIAQALVDDVLDDESLSAMQRQAAVLRILDATEPLESLSLEVTLPSDAAEVEAMGWQDMQALAARLLDDTGASGVPALMPGE